MNGGPIARRRDAIDPGHLAWRALDDAGRVVVLVDHHATGCRGA
ncbi:MAG TPA: hypothetical protein VMV46_05170 [Thermoanaerobaculia bacterium]|nr:hypothetical protein [Thermoanaerobaculia bacterium]